MKKNAHLSHKLVASILLLSLFLQSCDDFPNQVAPKEKKQASRTLALTVHPFIDSDKKIVTSGGYLASFYQEEGALKADLRVDKNQPSPNYQAIPVWVEEGTNLACLNKLDATTQQNRFQLKRDQNGRPISITILKGGISGGMMEGDDDQAKEKEKENKKEKSNLCIFPTEILQIIFSYVTYPHILACIRANHSFYEIITSYNQVGVTGVKNVPKNIFSNNWIIDKDIAFGGVQFRNLTRETIPSFFFYRLLGRVKHLPAGFWSYLKDTNITALDFSQDPLSDNFGDKMLSHSGVVELANHLQGTNIRILNLSGNYIGDITAAKLVKKLKGTKIESLDLSHNGITVITKLAEYLPHTNIQELDLGSNDIGMWGAGDLADCLQKTAIRTLDLTNNNIQSKGVIQLAKHLQETQIHSLNLEHNNIGAEGAIQLANHLQETNICILTLSSNYIGMNGIIELAKNLPGTKIHTVNLEYTRIGKKNQLLLKKKYPYINSINWTISSEECPIYPKWTIKDIEARLDDDYDEYDDNVFW